MKRPHTDVDVSVFYIGDWVRVISNEAKAGAKAKKTKEQTKRLKDKWQTSKKFFAFAQSERTITLTTSSATMSSRWNEKAYEHLFTTSRFLCIYIIDSNVKSMDSCCKRGPIYFVQSSDDLSVNVSGLYRLSCFGIVFTFTQNEKRN